MYCSREYQASTRLIQQYEKSTLNRNLGSLRNYTFIPMGSTVAVQQEDGDKWTHDTIVGKGDHNENNKSYKIHITKTG